MRLRYFGAAVLALALVAGCGSNDDSSTAEATTRSFTADNGTVEIPTDPQRVVATGYAVPALIEADAELVGISSWKRGIPLMTPEDLATYNKLTKVAGETAAETNYEAIAAAKPDLIVIGVPKPVLADIDLERLKGIAPVVAIGPTVPDAWRVLSQKQADAAGASEGFEAEKKTYEEKALLLKNKYAKALQGLKFGHVGGYGDISKGQFHREFAKSWGTNIAQDVGVTYYGQVKEPGEGSKAVSEYPSMEELSASLGEADAITYTVQPDGTPSDSVQAVLDSPLWKNLKAVKAGKVFAIRYTEAATYPAGTKTLDAIDQALAPLLAK
ncbi:ABC transporter substrate-binding protein [Cryptosporangium aurantiacum]|uniref:Iron complex transport system substrate-binding protein n=1 Tax=Cryptosporangium aurantiacum TaxID=134849 RepID=A0A1M7RMQ8_9ACTN|nr:ABC transporter substrate-binding protein [Cryptosporangium aurantiacum]SHN47489.1 iron complex transport system substrate-binding protein [Cryptosporangium aurantiacum]